MVIDQTVFNQVATTLARHFDSMYYVDIETGNYCEFTPACILEKMSIPKQGDDFFAYSCENAHKVVHPDDLDRVLNFHDKKTIMQNLEKNGSYMLSCRLLLDGKIVHVRHIDILCDDKKHIICCMENVEEEYREKEEQRRNLKSAERLARRDELTGIRNKNAFVEETRAIDDKIKTYIKNYFFGVVVCDINDLKKINDTRGHSFGDEAIQRASRMICEVFKHSPVFRIGGDEFAVLLSGVDYEQRDDLLVRLKEESLSNKKARSGPTIACGLAVYDADSDSGFATVFERADNSMYENKKEFKIKNAADSIRRTGEIETPIPDDRRRKLDSLFGALFTTAGEGYVYLNDMKYDFSRWSLPLIDDFGLDAEYMYHADAIWQEYVHPDDVEAYKKAVDDALGGNAELQQLFYRARRADGTYVTLTTRGFILNDDDGNPEYFGGLIFEER